MPAGWSAGRESLASQRSAVGASRLSTSACDVRFVLVHFIAHLDDAVQRIGRTVQQGGVRSGRARSASVVVNRRRVQV